MKNKLVTIALAAVIMFSMTACSSPTSPSGGGSGGGGGDGGSGGSISDMGGITSIAYGNGKFVAGGIGGVIATSTDGVTWTTIANASNPLYGKNLYAITYGNGKFVAASSYRGNTLAYSTNGITWTKVVDDSIFYTGPDYNKDPVDIEVIAYGNGKFVAGSWYGKMAYSTNDGATWTAVANASNPFYKDETKNSGDRIHGIAYGNGKFVAVGLSGKMAHSSDGVTWTAVTDSKFNTDSVHQIWSITWGNGKFVAGGNYGEMAYSSDGATWTATDSKFGKDTILDQIWGIAWGNNTFVAVGTDKDMSGVITTSPDGITWTKRWP